MATKLSTVLLGVAMLISFVCQSYSKAEDGPAGLDNVVLAPREARSVLRVRRWSIKSWWGEEQEEESESRERGRENEASNELANLCRSSCMSSWSAWGACNVRCGSSGTQTRSRRVAPPSKCQNYVWSNGCPGTTSERRGCNRRCENGGTLQPTSCTCPHGFKGTCCEQRVTCGHPGSPAYGSVSPTGSVHAYKTVVQFSCNTGYERKGSASRQCLHPGTWSNSVPTCQLVSCPAPSAPAHGSIKGNVFTYGSHVEYSCQLGFRLVGTKTLQCQANKQWSAAAPVCQALQCPIPSSPAHGSVSTPGGRTYQKTAHFSCDEGYFLRGSRTRTCQINEEWDGTRTTCELIVCSAPEEPENGEVTLSATVQGSNSVPYGGKAEFNCLVGHELVGDDVRICGGPGPVGVWSTDNPSCQAVDCGDPGIPDHGTRQGAGSNTFNFPNTLSFQCDSGYFMTGEAESTCLPNRVWSTPLPTCTACPLNTYKTGTNTVKKCSICPEYSHTLSLASTMQEHCLCDHGYKGPSGGPCTIISCPELDAPENGWKNTCSNVFGESCEFGCESGYIRSSGDFSRSCMLDEAWSGSQPQCKGCPVNTYQATETECVACPAHSLTTGPASVLTDCLCSQGYQGPPGGPCTDVDECAVNNGGCEQTCKNIEGSHRCLCTLPGYLRDAEDPTKCVVKNQCPALAAPGNGGLVCLAVPSISTERCSVKCNAGYEHPLTPNLYEECGPTTGWQWTTVINESPILDCTESFYPEIQLEHETAYFVESCDDLSQSALETAKTQLLNILSMKGVCSQDGTSVCIIEDVTVECGEVSSWDDWFFDDVDFFLRRRKRAAGHALVRLRFKLKIKKMDDFNCQASMPECDQDFEECPTCGQLYLKQLQDLLRKDRTKLKEIFSAPGCLTQEQGGDETPTGGPATLQLGSKTLNPLCGIKAKDPSISCPPGQQSTEGACVPCPPGSREVNGKCEYCKAGSHQPEKGQVSCPVCPDITPFSLQGATNCTGYTCEGKQNPCTKENIAANKMYYPNVERGRYVQCSASGQCYVMNCAAGLVWNPSSYTCTSSNQGYTCGITQNPCTKENIAAGRMFHPHADPGRYVQCSTSGQCHIMSCAAGLVWNSSINTCTFNNQM